MSVISDGCQKFERVIFQIVEGCSIPCTIIFQWCVPFIKDNILLYYITVKIEDLLAFLKNDFFLYKVFSTSSSTVKKVDGDSLEFP